MFNAAASSAVHNRERARTVDSAQGSDRSHSVSPATSSASLASAQPGSARSAMEPNAENSRERIFLPPPPPAPQPPADEGGGIGRRRRATTTTTEGATRLRRQTATEVGVGQDTLASASPHSSLLGGVDTASDAIAVGSVGAAPIPIMGRPVPPRRYRCIPAPGPIDPPAGSVPLAPPPSEEQPEPEVTERASRRCRRHRERRRLRPVGTSAIIIK